MGLRVITAPTSDPVSLSEAKAQCREFTSDHDGMIAGYLLAARQHAEGYTRRAFVTQTWDLTIDEAWPCVEEIVRGTRRRVNRIVMPKAPLQSVASVSYVDTAGATQVLAANQYGVRDIHQERAEGFIEPAYGVQWPSVRAQGAAITVRFACGYDSTSNPFPEPLRQAILLLTAHWFEHRETVNIGSSVVEIPFTVEALLFPYRLFY